MGNQLDKEREFSLAFTNTIHIVTLIARHPFNRQGKTISGSPEKKYDILGVFGIDIGKTDFVAATEIYRKRKGVTVYEIMEFDNGLVRRFQTGWSLMQSAVTDRPNSEYFLFQGSQGQTLQFFEPFPTDITTNIGRNYNVVSSAFNIDGWCLPSGSSQRDSREQ